MNSAAIVQLPVDDTISYKVYVAKAIPLADVAITAQLQLIVSNRDENPNLDSRIRSALKDFIDTHWTLLEQERSSATPGFERIRLKAIGQGAGLRESQVEGALCGGESGRA